MKLSAKQITVTAVLLAIAVASQFFKSAGVYLTGPVVNACLILAALSAGTGCGIILSVITPVTAFLIAGSPVMAAVPAIIPCVMAGNAILTFCTGLFYKKGKNNGAAITGMAAGAVLKAFFMGGVISLFLLPLLLPDTMKGSLAVFQAAFSVTQLITALIGSVYAFIIWLPLKKLGRSSAAGYGRRGAAE